MDQQFDHGVIRGLEKWPDVPACFGWLRLSRRGDWLIKDQPISHRRAIEYLRRNYAHDESGQWFVQNGPQRAYCTLDYTPWIYHLNGSDEIFTHTGHQALEVRCLVIDDVGNLLLETEHGIGLMLDRDLARFVEVLDVQQNNVSDLGNVADLLMGLKPGSINTAEISWDATKLPIQAMLAAHIPANFNFVATPAG